MINFKENDIKGQWKVIICGHTKNLVLIDRDSNGLHLHNESIEEDKEDVLKYYNHFSITEDERIKV